MPLVLDLLRHGHAEPAREGGDHARPLSPAGRSTLETLGARLAREGTRHDRVLASPLLRAVQSAEALLGAVSAPASVETLRELAPDSTPGAVLEALERLGLVRGHVLLVGHQPLLGQLALRLAGAETAFAPASLVRIECRDGPAPGAGRITLTLHAGARPA